MQKNLIWVLKQLSILLDQYGKFQMQEMDLSLTQGVILHYLLTHQGMYIYGIDLHVILGISRSSISATLKALKNKGYINMRENPSDDRKKKIVLTKKSYDMQQQIDASLIAQQRQLYQGVPEERLNQLEKDLDQMLVNMKQSIGQEVLI